MTKAIIVDIDGTIADCSARLHHIKGPNRDWGKFWVGMENDLPIQHVIQLVRAMWRMRMVGGSQEHIEIIVVTARDKGVEHQTVEWLKRHIPYDQLYMREANDFRKDAIVKKELLDQIRARGYDVLFALEDRDHNVEMFRANGVPCLQVAADEDKPEERNWRDQHVCTLLVGPVCAGKSTFTKTFDASDVVSSDAIREALTPWRRSDSEATWKLLTEKDHGRVWHALHDLVQTRVRNGLITVVDATNIKRADRMKIVNLVPRTQRIEYVVLDRPLEDKIRDRGWRSEELVRKMHDSFNAGIKHVLRGDDQPHVFVTDMRKALG